MRNKVVLVKSKEIYRNQWLSLQENDYQFPDNTSVSNYAVIEEKDGVNILPITKDKKIVIIGQYRGAVEQYSYEFPGGFFNNESEILERAKEVLLLEAKSTAKAFKLIGEVYPAPHRFNKKQICAVALDVEVSASVDAQIKVVSLDQLNKMIEDDQFKCAGCISTLYKATAAGYLDY